MSRNIEQGTIKLVWITDDVKKLFSKMFDSIDEAEAYATKNKLKDYLISKLEIQEGNEEFTWEILPFGRYGLYKKLFELYHKGLLKKLI